MAITSKSELKSEVSEWLDNPHWFDNRADTMITLAEARLNRELRGRLAKTDDTLTGTVASREVSLPADFAELLGLWLTTSGGREDLKAYTPALLPQTETSGDPCAYAVSGSSLILNRPCDQAHAFDIFYLAKFALSTDADTNWLLTNFPDVYFAALMVEAFAFKRDIDAASAWDGKLQALIEQVNTFDARSDSAASLNFDAALTRPRYFDLTRG